MAIALGLGLGLPFGGQSWTPANLGSSLLGWWDAERTDKLSLSGSSVTTWTDVVGSYAATQGISGSKPRWDANAFGGVLNKCANTNSNPQNLTNISAAAYPSAVLSVVDDSAALAAAGLSAYGPNVYKLDNSAGATDAFADITGIVGNTNSHVVVAWCRGGTGILQDNFGTGATSFGAAANYTRRVSAAFTPGATSRRAFVGANPGQIVYFTLNGLYEGSTAPTQDVLVNGAAAYGFGRPGVIFDGSDDELTLGSVPFPINADPCEIWTLVDQQLPVSDATTRISFGYGGASFDLQRRTSRTVSGTNQASSTIGTGAGLSVTASGAGDFLGRHVTRATVSATTVQSFMDGVGGSALAAVPATGNTRTRIGGAPNATASAFWQGQIAAVLITGALSTDQASQLLAYLKSRGGIA